MSPPTRQGPVGAEGQRQLALAHDLALSEDLKA